MLAFMQHSTIRPAVSTENRLVTEERTQTDGQTDRHRATANTALT